MEMALYIHDWRAQFNTLQPVAATLTKNSFLWLATFGPKIEMDFVAELKITKRH